ncbi:MAG: metalloregulator ArsR/SmtB family transcription factor [Tepidiformaceae bacterium]
MMTLQDYKADLFRTLGNPVRIRILEALQAAGSLTVGELQQRVGVEPANVSQHLAVLRSRGIVAVRREGTSGWYSVPDRAIFELLGTARSVFESHVAAEAELLVPPSLIPDNSAG